MPVVHLRPADRGDFSLILNWLKLPEVQRWWGSLGAAEAVVLAALQQPMGLCSIVIVDGEPAGYIQAQDSDVGGEGRERGCYRVDAIIGEPRFRGKGISGQALELAAEEVFQTTLALGLVAVVSIRNEGAVRLYERAGFKWLRVIDDGLLGKCWLMRRDRGG